MNSVRLFLMMLILFGGWGYAAPSYPSGTSLGENRLLGNSMNEWWILDADQAHAHEIEGFAYPQAVNVGENVKLFINTEYPTYDLRIYRLGYYGGTGARRVFESLGRVGIAQPPCNSSGTTGVVDCGNWAAVLSVNTSQFTSGVFLVKLDGRVVGGQRAKSRHFLFVVRDDSRPSRFLVQIETNTIQAYNVWGNKSLAGNLYNDNPDGVGFGLYAEGERSGAVYGWRYRQDLRPRAVAVSYRRPVASDTFGLLNQGTGEFMKNAYPFIRWAEANGFDLTYVDDVSVGRFPSLLLSHRAVLVVGHGEYWSQSQRDRFDEARNHGVNLAFFSGNEAYWRVDHRPVGNPDYSVMWCFKAPANSPFIPSVLSAGSFGDPVLGSPTVLFREVGQPEGALVGVQYEDTAGFNAGAVLPSASQQASLPQIFENTGASDGVCIPDAYRYEADRVAAIKGQECLRVIASGTDPNGRLAQSTVYRLKNNSGGTVVGLGSIMWGSRLDDWTNVSGLDSIAPPSDIARAMTKRIMEWLSAPLDVSQQTGCYLPRAPSTDPRGVLRADGRREAFFFDANGDMVVRADAYDGDSLSAISSWTGFDGVGVPSVAVNQSGAHEFFYRRRAGGVQARWELPGGGFGALSFPGWNSQGNPAVVVRSDGRHEVFYRASGGVMHLRWQATAGDSFPGFASFAWGDMAGDPVVALAPDGRHEVFYRTSSGALAVRWEAAPGDGFAGGATLPSDWSVVGNPAVIRRSDGRHEIFYRNTVGDLVARWEVSAGDGFVGGTTFQHWGLASDPTVVVRPDGRHSVFFRDGNTASTVRSEVIPGDGYPSWIGYRD